MHENTLCLMLSSSATEWESMCHGRGTPISADTWISGLSKALTLRVVSAWYKAGTMSFTCLDDRYSHMDEMSSQEIPYLTYWSDTRLTPENLYTIQSGVYPVCFKANSQYNMKKAQRAKIGKWTIAIFLWMALLFPNSEAMTSPASMSNRLKTYVFECSESSYQHCVNNRKEVMWENANLTVSIFVPRATNPHGYWNSLLEQRRYSQLSIAKKDTCSILRTR